MDYEKMLKEIREYMSTIDDASKIDIMLNREWLALSKIQNELWKLLKIQYGKTK